MMIEDTTPTPDSLPSPSPAWCRVCGHLAVVVCVDQGASVGASTRIALVGSSAPPPEVQDRGGPRGAGAFVRHALPSCTDRRVPDAPDPLACYGKA
jgi:hypothetical protein